jgi:hypothetical protein
VVEDLSTAGVVHCVEELQVNRQRLRTTAMGAGMSQVVDLRASLARPNTAASASSGILRARRHLRLLDSREAGGP